MGSVALDAAAKSSSGGSTFIILIVVIIGLMYFLVARPGRKRQQRAQQQQQSSVLPGARVRTTAGMYATVVAVDGDDVILEVAPDVEVRYMKRAVMEVIGDTGTAEDEDVADEHGEDGIGEDGIGEDEETVSDEVDETPDTVAAGHEGTNAGDTNAGGTNAGGTNAGGTNAGDTTAGHEPDEAALPVGGYGEDLTINGQPDRADQAKAKVNGRRRRGATATSESTATQD